MSFRHGFRSFSARRRRTVSRDRLSCSVSLTISPASNSRVQRARPVRWLGAGGRHQQRLLLAAQLARRSGPRLLAQRSLQIASDEAPLGPVNRRAARTRRWWRSLRQLAPASAARRICARLSLRAACLPPLSKRCRARRARLGSARPDTVHSSVPPRWMAQANRSMSLKSGTARAAVHRKSGQSRSHDQGLQPFRSQGPALVAGGSCCLGRGDRHRQARQAAAKLVPVPPSEKGPRKPSGCPDDQMDIA